MPWMLFSRRVECELGMEEKPEEIGKITHFFSKINVAVVELTAPLNVGDKIHVMGPTTDFEQTVDSMQIEHENVKAAEKGQSIGLKVKERVRENDTVYKVT
jgi:putative protease